MTIAKPVVGVCLPTALFVCSAAGFPVAPDNLPTASAPLTTEYAVGAPIDLVEGQELTFTADGFADNAAVTVTLYSEPVTLAEVVANDAGVVQATVTTPEGVTGTHTLSALGVDPSGSARSLQTQLAIAAASPGVDTLAFTGASIAGMVLGGIGMIVAGFVLLRTMVFRRRLLPQTP